MVDVSSFKRDARAMRDGEWINPGPEYGGLEIKCRALAHQYLDAQAAKLRAAARGYDDDVSRVPSEVRGRINIDCLIEHGLLDVRGLTDGGEPIGFAEFCELLRDPGAGELTSLAFTCCGRVGRQRAADLQAAAGNSVPASAAS